MAAVSRILTEPAVETLETTFAWAGAIEAPTAVPPRVTVPAAAVELLEQCRRLLRDAKISSAQILSGPSWKSVCLPVTRSARFLFKQSGPGRPCEVRVTLIAAEVDRAHQWAIAKRVVVVEGAVQSQRGRPLRILNPQRVLPVDETMLADE